MAEGDEDHVGMKDVLFCISILCHEHESCFSYQPKATMFLENLSLIKVMVESLTNIEGAHLSIDSNKHKNL